MQVSKIIERLQELDPSGTLEVMVDATSGPRLHGITKVELDVGTDELERVVFFEIEA